MTIARAIVADLAADPDALAELCLLIAAAGPSSSLEPSGLLTPAEVAERCRVSVRTVNRWAALGRLDGVKVGKAWRFTPESVDVLQTPSVPSGTVDRLDPRGPGAKGRGRRVRSDPSVADAIRGG